MTKYVSVCIQREIPDLPLLYPSLSHEPASKARHNMVRITKLLTALLAISFGAITVNGEKNNACGGPLCAQDLLKWCQNFKEVGTLPRRTERWLRSKLQRRARQSAEVNSIKIPFVWDLNHNILKKQTCWRKRWPCDLVKALLRPATQHGACQWVDNELHLPYRIALPHTCTCPRSYLFAIQVTTRALLVTLRCASPALNFCECVVSVSPWAIYPSTDMFVQV